jgi:hypothetical protein
MPVCSLEEVDEVDAQSLFGLADLPILEAATAFDVLAEAANLIRQRLVGRRTRQEAAHPPNEVWGSGLPDQLIPQDELPELLQGHLKLAHQAPFASPSSKRPAGLALQA